MKWGRGEEQRCDAGRHGGVEGGRRGVELNCNVTGKLVFKVRPYPYVLVSKWRETSITCRLGAMDLMPDDANTQWIQSITTVAICIFGIFLMRQRLSADAVYETPSGHNGCNDPNCIRCHSGSAHHLESFRRNVTLLRRLVKLEPDIFDGMREDIWTVIEDMEQRRVGKEGDHRRSKATSNPSVETRAAQERSSTILPLSPQRGQDPTVLFIPNLVAIPFHQGSNECYTTCPCVHLWKSPPIEILNISPIRTMGDIEILRMNYDIIRNELDNLLLSNNDAFAPFDSGVYTSFSSNTNHEQTPEWSSIYLYHQGLKQQLACKEYFPQTTQIIETMCPNRMAGKCSLGSIYLSKLKSNTRVHAHCGPTNVRWRCHLPLVVPKDCKDSRLCVGIGANEVRVGWEEGVPILFDDSFLHSAVHVSSQSEERSRMVLIVDFWHPALSEADRTAIGVLYPPVGG